MCKVVTWGFGLLYLFALGVFAIGTFGLAGQPRDPLSGIFLVPLGLPWNLLIDRLPEAMWPALAALAPAVNLGLIVLICRLIRRNP